MGTQFFKMSGCVHQYELCEDRNDYISASSLYYLLCCMKCGIKILVEEDHARSIICNSWANNGLSCYEWIDVNNMCVRMVDHGLPLHWAVMFPE